MTIAYPKNSALKEYLNIIDYGAKGDGITDDAAAIQSAINLTPSGSSLFFPPGTYLLGSNITWKSNVKYFSDGAFLDGDNKTNSTYIESSGTNIVLSGLNFIRFDRCLSHTTTALVYNLKIENCIFDDSNNGIYLICACGNTHIRACTIKNISSDVASGLQIGKNIDENEQTDIYITNNTIRSIYSSSAGAVDTHGILCRGGRVHVIGNVVEDVSFAASTGTGCEGIYVVCHQSIISHNILKNAGNREASIVLKGNRPDGGTVQGSQGYANQVSSNVIISDVSDASAIFIQSEDTLVNDNVIEGFGDSGIKITSNSNYCHVTNNTLSKLTSSVGIRLSDTHSYIANNLIIDPLSSKSTFYAIYATSESNEILSMSSINNRIIFGSGLTSSNTYYCYLNCATNNFSNVLLDDDVYCVGPTGTSYGIGFGTAAAGPILSDVTLKSRLRGNYTTLLRYLSASNPALDVDFNLNTGPQSRTAVGSTTINIHEAGRTITNVGASGTITALLPAAKINAKYNFIRTDAFTFRVDPNGTEIIMGGGSGKYLSLDSDGCSVGLFCASSGVWQIISNSGTTSFQP